MIPNRARLAPAPLVGGHAGRRAPGPAAGYGGAPQFAAGWLDAPRPAQPSAAAEETLRPLD